MRYIIFAFVMIVLHSCKHQQKETETVKEKEQSSIVQSEIDTTNNYQQTSLFLAGKAEFIKSSIDPKLFNNSAYRIFSDTMNTGFNSMETNRLSKMRTWASTELKDEINNAKTVFYPFSGPDFLHCVQFYPNADQYVMIALEKYGSLPMLSDMDSAKALQYLNSVTASLEDIFGKSYFITRKMLKDVSNQVNGFVPLTCVFLARTNHVVKDIQYKHLNDDSTIAVISAEECGKNLNDFVEIYFTKEGEDHLRKIVYFKANLCDDIFAGMKSFKENTVLQFYLNSLPDFYTYVKSASYLMNYKSFDIIRNICLKKSISILQDDTGIAYRYVNKEEWEMKFYGKYLKPVDDFSGVWQYDLDSVYKVDSLSIPKLPFSLGYHWGKQDGQNLMKFSRKKS